MPNLKRRLLTIPLAGAAMAIGFGLLAAPAASAHEGPTPVANIGDAVDYGAHQVQAHLDAPMLGLNPAIADPLGYTGSHVFPVGGLSRHPAPVIRPNSHTNNLSVRCFPAINNCRP